MTGPVFPAPISEEIWNRKYRFGREAGIEETWRRVARAVASAETHDVAAWEQRFFDLLSDFRFLPGGRILANAGTARSATLLNCFVMGVLDDSVDGLFHALRESAVTLQAGGGIGLDFSPVRPAGMAAKRTGNVASGPVSFMHLWDAMCETMTADRARRGAMMAVLRCDHPDIEAFIDAKLAAGNLSRFNLSVAVTDGFVRAVDEDADWPLVFGGKTHRTVKARTLWDRILRSAYHSGEPGVLFIDRINQLNNLGRAETIHACNPCGEVPLPPYGACDLGSVNLTRFVKHPFTADAALDLEGICALVAPAIRFLDNVLDVSHFPLAPQKEEAMQARRVGLGITGLADALVMLGIGYGSEAGRALASRILETMRDAAYRASAALAAEKGSFPCFRAADFLTRPFVARLPEDVRDGIARTGLRNSHLMAIAPTGSISLLAGNVSAGIEPVFAAKVRRRVRRPDGAFDSADLEDYAVRLWQAENGADTLPPAFVTAGALSPEDHLAMQAAAQAHVDNAISKTINADASISLESFGNVYRRAYELGLKGCTVYRQGSRGADVLTPMTGAVCTADTC
ncbi:MAG: adenosylcobalamin-dependent ribonucleoside-diphosphate reductase [Hyphomonas sp.]|uniref:adenosylcobalamin-dependent ribonucleoside-diphosphate reductase n=1 Tax=Hyphomonas sp. TaxID=87 RepID=UPI0035289C03